MKDNNILNKISVEDEEIKREKIYEKGYLVGSVQTLARLGGLYVAYKVNCYLIKKWILFSNTVKYDDDDE